MPSLQIWSKVVLELLGLATSYKYKEWMNTLWREDISVATEITEPEDFLVYTNKLLKMFGIKGMIPSEQDEKEMDPIDDDDENMRFSSDNSEQDFSEKS